MPASPGLRRAILVAFGFIAVSCGSETIDLLPAPTPAGAAGSLPNGGSGGNGGSHESGAAENQSGRAGSASEAGHGGAAGKAGGNSGGCSGGQCGGFNFGGFAGITASGGSGGAFCAPGEPLQCGLGFRCDEEHKRCVAVCRDDQDCEEGRMCDKREGICVVCVHDFDCEFDPDEDTHFCQDNHCVECLGNADCEWQGDPKLECDTQRGRCE